MTTRFAIGLHIEVFFVVLMYTLIVAKIRSNFIVTKDHLK